MNFGLLQKSWNETWKATLVYGSVLVLLETTLAYVLFSFQDELSQSWMQVEFFQRLLQGILGTEADDGLGPGTFLALPWLHPAILGVLWAHAINYCTRIPVREIERGTIDVFLGLPVSRRELYLHDSIVWLLSGGLVFLLMGVGNLVGTFAADVDDPPSIGLLLQVLLNLFALYLAVGGLTYLVSSLSQRRGRAVVAVFLLLLGSLFLNFLTPFWEAAKGFRWLNLLHYYQPVRLLAGDGIPPHHLIILLAVGAAGWGVGGWCFGRRDIYTL